MNLEDIRERLSKFAQARNWDQFHTPKNLSMALAAEAAELLEIFQWLTDEQSKDIVYNEKEMAQIRQEIADVMIYLIRLSDKLDIDIEKAVLDKIELNEKKYPVELAKDNAIKYNKRDDEHIACNSGIVVGIDVGGPKKGFHAIALRDGRYFKKFSSLEVDTMGTWCKAIGVRIIGIDSPCRWSSNGKSRSAERALAAEKISCHSTPSMIVATKNSFYPWMLNGAELYSILEPDYPLYSGNNLTAKSLCFETYPHAVCCALAGKIVSAKQKSTIRRELVNKAGIDTSALTNIDFIDAALCALTAHHLALGRIKTYGDATDGIIVVPAFCSNGQTL
jgi:NTP pyrophosphatase (non-canonical NTP hydrolase)/predicted nuclease with RNAse H fold